MTDTSIVEEKVQRADLALADLTANGGVLDPEHQNTFFQNVIDEPTLINQIRQQPMNASEMKIPKLGFGSRVLRVAPNTGMGGAKDDGDNDRFLRAADRVKPDFGQVRLNTTEYMAEIHLHDDLLEDNIERDQMAETIMTLLSERVATDLEELFIGGNTASGDPFLASLQGLLELSGANTVDVDGDPVSINTFNTSKKAMPTRYRRNLSTLRHFYSMDVESDYRVQVAARGSTLGDATLVGNAPMSVLGVPLQGVALMPENTGILMNPKNAIFGMQRSVRIERERVARARSWVIVMSMRIGFALEEVNSVVKTIDLGAL